MIDRWRNELSSQSNSAIRPMSLARSGLDVHRFLSFSSKHNATLSSFIRQHDVYSMVGFLSLTADQSGSDSLNWGKVFRDIAPEVDLTSLKYLRSPKMSSLLRLVPSQEGLWEFMKDHMHDIGHTLQRDNGNSGLVRLLNQLDPSIDWDKLLKEAEESQKIPKTSSII